MRLLLYPIASVALVGLWGCGGQGFHQVKGKVVYMDGSDVSVLTGGFVLFDPADPEGPPKGSARGEIHQDGSFTMGRYKEGDGVIPGKYRVMVTQPPFLGGRGKVPPPLLDPRFKDFESSGLEITVSGPIADYSVTVAKP